MLLCKLKVLSGFGISYQPRKHSSVLSVLDLCTMNAAYSMMKLLLLSRHHHREQQRKSYTSCKDVTIFI